MIQLCFSNRSQYTVLIRLFIVTICILPGIFPLMAQPVIESFSPLKGPTGTVVTINGNHFDPQGENNTVFFGGMRAVISSASATELKVVVPPGTTYKPISVTTAGLTAYSSTPFNVTYVGGDILTDSLFAEKVDSLLAGTAYEPAIADLDGDGRSDVVLIGLEAEFQPFLVSILRNTSTGSQISFAAPLNFNSFGTPYKIAVGDLDGDTRLDLAVLQYTGSCFTVYRNTSTPGNISFTRVSEVFNIGPTPMYIAIHDVDGDGRGDILTHSDIFFPMVCLFRNTSHPGSISFTPKINLNVTTLRYYMEDLDTDGRPDLAAYDSRANVFSIYRNISTPGNVLFAVEENIDASASGGFILGDINGDGKNDIITKNGKSLTLFKNTSEPGVLSFSAGVNSGLAEGVHGLADINGDGYADIVSSVGDGSVISVTINTSTATTVSFGAKKDYVTGRRPYLMAVGDLNNDGKPDMISTNISNTFSVLRNKVTEPKLIPSGNNQVNSEVYFNVSVDSTVNAHNGNPYVQRHYDIQPATDPETSTATATLYFTQEDFDNFNVYVTTNNKLPAHPTDITGKANLRVYQYHGTSSTGEPGSYSGNGIEINPDDSKIVWNASLQIWEITFDIIGFSGFFLGSSGSSILPLTLTSFTAEEKGKNPVLRWSTSNEINTKEFLLMRATGRGTFKTITTIKAKGNSDVTINYQYTDTLHTDDVHYYRLTMVDIDGTERFSKTVSIVPKLSQRLFSIFPNPAKSFIVARHPATASQATIRIIDPAGRLIKTIRVQHNTKRTDIDLQGIAPGAYRLVWTDGIRSEQQSFFIR